MCCSSRLGRRGETIKTTGVFHLEFFIRNLLLSRMKITSNNRNKVLSHKKTRKTRKTKTGNFVSNWNWIFLFFPHSSFAQCGFSFNTAADGGHSPNMSEASGRAPEYSNSRANWYKLIHSSCIELYNSSSTRVSLETTVAPAPAGFFFLRVYKRERARGAIRKNTEASRG